MKLIIIILFTTLMQVSASTFGQKVTLAERNASLEKVFQKMRQQTGYDFLFDAEVVKLARPVNINVSNAPLSEALELCLKNQNLDFTIEEKSVIVSRAKEKGFLDNIIARFQNIDVRGKVVDSLGNGIAGATVSVKNGKGSTSTAIDGDFYLKNVTEGSVLVISFMGYITKEQVVIQEFNRVILNQSTSQLDEIQIIAYGATSRRLSTGNIATVKSDEIEKQLVTNPLLLLQGRIPGLLVTPSSGNQNASINIQLRGQNSLRMLPGSTASIAGVSPLIGTEPLFVIDGVPYANNTVGVGGPSGIGGQISAFAFIDQASIASIDILKDADATSIYGSRGANGVILITTKKGQGGKVKVDLSSVVGIANVANRIKLLNTEQYISMRKEAFKNDGLSTPSSYNTRNYDLTLWDQNKYTDWQELFIGGTAHNYQSRLSITGGSQIIQYLILAGYNKRGFVSPGDARNQNGNTSVNVSGNTYDKKFKVNYNVSYARSTEKAPIDMTSLIALPPNAPDIYRDNGELNWAPNPNTGFATWNNPFVSLLKSTDSKYSLINNNLDMSLNLFEHLTAKATFGLSDQKGESFGAEPITVFDPMTRSTAIRSSNFQSSYSRSWSVDPQLLYLTNVSKGQLNILIGGSLQQQAQGYQTLTARGFSSDGLLRSLGLANSFSALNTSSEYKYIGFFGRLNYNWIDKYLLNLNVRRDGSSRFGPGNQFGSFASLGAAWIFTNEKFFKDRSWLNFGKLRFSFGTSGNDGVGDYQYLQLYEPLGNELYQGLPALKSQNIINPNYSWETVYKGELGVDLGFFGDRLILSSAYYRNRSTSQIGLMELPKTAGNGANFFINLPAKIQNSGFEFTLNTTNISSKSFAWKSTLNLTVQRNKLISLPKGSRFGGFIDDEHLGQPFAGVAYALVFRGVNSAIGKYQFANLADEATSDSFASLVRSRIDVSPRFFGGINNSVTFKGMGISFLLQFSKQKGKNYVFDPIFTSTNARPGQFFSSGGVIPKGNQPIDVLKRWQKIGDIAEIQKFSTSYNPDFIGAALNLLQGSDKNFVDASFLRLKNLNVSYTFPNNFIRKIKVNSLRIYLEGQNIFTLTNYKGLDPEVQSLSSLPQLRVLSTGVQVGF